MSADSYNKIIMNRICNFYVEICNLKRINHVNMV